MEKEIPGDFSCKVEQVILHDEGLFELILERGGLSFTPGDCVALFGADGQSSRPYSIASGVEDDQLSFNIRLMEGGVVSTYLQSRKPGNKIVLSPPFGWFRPGQNIGDAPFVFIATGTGVSPFLAYRHSFPDRPPAMMLYGVRQLRDALGLNALKGWCPLHLALSREENNSYYQGRVTDHLTKLPLQDDMHYYLCGLDTMIDEVSDWLESKHIDIFNIHREVFFHE